jgi:hypothetical protein
MLVEEILIFSIQGISILKKAFRCFRFNFVGFLQINLIFDLFLTFCFRYNLIIGIIYTFIQSIGDQIVLCSSIRKCELILLMWQFCLPKLYEYSRIEIWYSRKYGDSDWSLKPNKKIYHVCVSTSNAKKSNNPIPKILVW